MINRIMPAVVMLVGGLGLSLAQAPAPGSADAKLISEFKERVNQYLQLRERVAGSAPSSSDVPEKLAESRNEFSNKIRAARGGAKQGEIFRPEVAQYFQREISATLNGRYGNDIRATLRHAEPVKMKVQINQSYPENVPLQSTPPTLLLNLPELPNSLEYRILGRDLVLRDSDANIVVDYVPNALPGSKQ